jgi:hypothetical protein
MTGYLYVFYVTLYSWDTYDNLSLYQGSKKLTNYIKAIQAHEEWRKSASPEERESADVALEMQREAYSEWLKVDRIVAVRDKEEEIDDPDHQTRSVVKQQYLVKWKGLSYGDCTWEDPNGRYCSGSFLLVQLYRSTKAKLMPFWLGIKAYLFHQAIQLEDTSRK